MEILLRNYGSHSCSPAFEPAGFLACLLNAEEKPGFADTEMLLSSFWSPTRQNSTELILCSFTDRLKT